MAVRDLPAGLVTFAFVDVVGSTRAFADHGPRYVDAVQEVQALVASVTEGNRGVVVETEGDGAFLAFPAASDALAALRLLQDRLRERNETAALPLAVRAGAHVGEAQPLGDKYFAFPVHVAARVASAANGGQVLITDAVRVEAGDETVVELGSFELKDIGEPVALFRAHGEAALPRALPARKTNVEIPRTSFLGRDAELELLQGAIAVPGLTTIVGPGGLGKTRLASEFALTTAQQFRGGAWLVELAKLDGPDGVAGVVGAALGADSSVGPDQIVHELSRRGELLLVLDNCEHVIDSVVELVERLLASCADLRVLCTSREPLGVADERVVRLRPLTRGRGEVPGPAQQLFIARASRAGTNVDPDGLEHVTAICQTLDCLPLALELAATQVGSMPLPSLRERLESGDMKLSQRGGVARLRSLDDLVDWSLRLLPQDQLDAMLALSVLPGRFSLSMGESLLSRVASARHDVIPDLARRSLIDLDGQDYRLLATVRETARRKLRDRPDLAEQADAALVGWAVDLAAELSPKYSQNPERNQDMLLTLETALAMALESDTPGWGRVFDVLRVPELVLGVSERLRELADRILARPLPTDEDTAVGHVAALEIRVMASKATPPPDHQLVALLDAARKHATGPALERAYSTIATAYEATGRAAEAGPLREAALAVTETHPDARGNRGQALAGLMMHHYALDDLQTALGYAEGALAEAEAFRHEDDIVIQRSNVAWFNLKLGRPDEAARHALKALASSSPNSSLQIHFDLLTTMAEIELHLGHPETAREFVVQARDLEPRVPESRYRQPVIDQLEEVSAQLDRAAKSDPTEPS